ncbi:MAG: hypothetical protein ACKV2O_09600 [Acidimicrobiales bacterium]
MTVTELAAIVVVITASVATTVLVALCWDLRRAAAQLRRSARALDDGAAVLVEELQATLADARRSLGHAESHLERAGQVVEVIDQASKLTYRTVAGPVIKAAAVANGVRKGAEFLRGGPRGAAHTDNGGDPIDRST